MDWGSERSNAGIDHWAVAIFDFIKDLQSGMVSHILKFADDVKIFEYAVEVMDGNHLERDLDVIVDWTENGQIRMNTDKM